MYIVHISGKKITVLYSAHHNMNILFNACDESSPLKGHRNLQSIQSDSINTRSSITSTLYFSIFVKPFLSTITLKILIIGRWNFQLNTSTLSIQLSLIHNNTFKYSTNQNI